MNRDARPTLSSATELMLRLRQSDSLPALDENVAQLCRLAANSDTRTADLTAVIMRDGALTSRLLTMANSAAYRARNAVKTVSAAVVMLGFERIRQLAVGLSLFHRHAENVRDKDLYRLLVCVYCSGLFAMSLGRRMRCESPEELFVRGILTQLPRLALRNAFPEKYREMEMMVWNEGRKIEQACESVFGVGYEELAVAMSEHWHLPESCRPGGAPTGLTAETCRQTVHVSAAMADLLFGNLPPGPQETERVVEQARALLRSDSFSLPEFVGAAAQEDANMESFFHLSQHDMIMMARIAEWGKVDAAQVAEALTGSYQRHDGAREADESPLAMSHFLSELMIAVHKRADVNTILMLAMEGVYRCLRPDCVIAAFVDRSRACLRGRFYAGRLPGVDAARYRAALKEADLPAIRNLRSSKTELVSAKSGPITPDDRLLLEMDIDSVLLAPIRSGDKAIGQFFLGRRTAAAPFAADDLLSMIAIAGHVALAFEMSGKERS